MLWETRCQVGEQQGRKPSMDVTAGCLQTDIQNAHELMFPTPGRNSPEVAQLTSAPCGYAFNPRAYHHANPHPLNCPKSSICSPQTLNPLGQEIVPVSFPAHK